MVNLGYDSATVYEDAKLVARAISIFLEDKEVVDLREALAMTRIFTGNEIVCLPAIGILIRKGILKTAEFFDTANDRLLTPAEVGAAADSFLRGNDSARSREILVRWRRTPEWKEKLASVSW